MTEPVTTAPREAADPRLVGLRRLAIVPAYNEAEAIEAVIAELRAFDPELEIVVIDDGSMDGTAGRAAKAGVEVVRLPFNLGIGGAMQTGYQYARDHGFDLAIQVDGDGQHDPREITMLIEPILEGSADMTVGTPFCGRRTVQAALRAANRHPALRALRVADRAAACHGHHLGLPRRQS